MNLNSIQPPEGSTQSKRRVGRGIGSGMGKTCTRGTKGQKARRQISPAFEGGQTPIHRRLPVKKGFQNVNHRTFAVVNLDDLEKHFEAGEAATPETIVAKHIVGELKDGLKILAFGTLSKKLDVSAHHFSKAAKARIEELGGTASVVEDLKKPKVEKRSRRTKKEAGKAKTAQGADAE